MEDGGLERGVGEPWLQVDDGAGLNGLILLLLTARPPLPAPGDGAARGEPPETGSGPRGGLARSLQRAEAMLRSTPGLRRLLPPRPRQRGHGEDEEEDEEEPPAVVVALEQSFEGLHRCLRVWEDPRTETFQGHVRPPPGDATGTGTGTSTGPRTRHPHPAAAPTSPPAPGSSTDIAQRQRAPTPEPGGGTESGPQP